MDKWKSLTLILLRGKIDLFTRFFPWEISRSLILLDNRNGRHDYLTSQKSPGLRLPGPSNRFTVKQFPNSERLAVHKVIKELIEVRQQHALTLREISTATNMTEKSIWRVLNNGDCPQKLTIQKLQLFLTATKKRIQKEDRIQIDNFKEIILNAVYSGPFFFLPCDTQGRKREASYSHGVGRIDVNLEDLKKECEIVGLKDDLLLRAFDEIAGSGRIKILAIFQPVRRKMSAGEAIFFKIECGTATRSNPFIPTIDKLDRSFKDQPLSEKEKEGFILHPSRTVQGMRLRRENSMKIMHGASGLEAEGRLHREALEEESEARNLARENAESLKKIAGKGVKKMGEEFQGSEFDTVTHRVRAREFEEVRIENNSRVPQVCYCQKTGQKLELAPGESGLIFKLKKQKMPVEKTEIK